MSSKNFIQDATADAHGQFVKKAQAAGMSTITFARKKANAPGITGKQARLAKTLIGLNPKKKKSPSKAVRAPMPMKPVAKPAAQPAAAKAPTFKPMITPPGMQDAGY